MIKLVMSMTLPQFADAEAFRAFRSDSSRWLPIALDIARSHGLDVGAPQVFVTGTNLVVGLGERLILKIFPPLLHA
jgi:hygromycin-B 7''-O-kinase